MSMPPPSWVRARIPTTIQTTITSTIATSRFRSQNHSQIQKEDCVLGKSYQFSRRSSMSNCSCIICSCQLRHWHISIPYVEKRSAVGVQLTVLYPKAALGTGNIWNQVSNSTHACTSMQPVVLRSFYMYSSAILIKYSIYHDIINM